MDKKKQIYRPPKKQAYRLGVAVLAGLLLVGLYGCQNAAPEGTDPTMEPTETVVETSVETTVATTEAVTGSTEATTEATVEATEAATVVHSTSNGGSSKGTGNSSGGGSSSVGTSGSGGSSSAPTEAPKPTEAPAPTESPAPTECAHNWVLKGTPAVTHTENVYVCYCGAEFSSFSAYESHGNSFDKMELLTNHGGYSTATRTVTDEEAHEWYECSKCGGTK